MNTFGKDLAGQIFEDCQNIRLYHWRILRTCMLNFRISFKTHTSQDWAWSLVLFPLSPYSVWAVDFRTIWSIEHQVMSIQWHTHRGRCSYFHLRLTISCNMLVATEATTATRHTVPASRHRSYNGPLDSGTAVTGAKEWLRTKDLDQDWWLAWLKLCEVVKVLSFRSVARPFCPIISELCILQLSERLR